MTSPVHLVDASVYIFRAWFSMPDEFTSVSGEPTGAVYGFARFLCELLEQTGSRHIAVAFDGSLTSSFRNEIYPDYKANRESAPPELKRQIEWCRAVAASLGLPCYIHDRFEADDLIGTLATHWRGQGHPLHILTSDKDLAQLVEAGDIWWDFSRRRRLDADQITEHFGVRPDQIADFLALTGDSVDNIPGVPGVGPKTAAPLLTHFQTLDGLYGRLDEIQYLRSIRGARTLAGRLREHREAAYLARRLTGIVCDVGEILADPAVDRRDPDTSLLEDLLDELGFGRMLRQRLRDRCEL